jgi:hypothetical protein
MRLAVGWCAGQQRDLGGVNRLGLPVLVQDSGLGRLAGNDLGAQRALPLPGGQQKVGPGAVDISRPVPPWFVEGRLRPLAGRDELVVEPADKELVEGDHAHGPHDKTDHREQCQQSGEQPAAKAPRPRAPPR